MASLYKIVAQFFAATYVSKDSKGISFIPAIENYLRSSLNSFNNLKNKKDKKTTYNTRTKRNYLV